MILNDRWETTELIETNSFSRVYKGQEKETGQLVVIKFDPSGSVLQGLESHGVDKISHPNVVKYLDINTMDIDKYVVMEYVPGYSLQEVVQHQKPFSWYDAQPLLRQIAGALSYSQRHGFTCDPDTSNIIFTPTRPFVPKIIDWLTWGEDESTVFSLAVASFCYVASELFLGRQLTHYEEDLFDRDQLSPDLEDHPAFPQVQAWLKEKDSVNLEKDVLSRLARAREARRYKPLTVTQPQQQQTPSPGPLRR